MAARRQNVTNSPKSDAKSQPFSARAANGRPYIMIITLYCKLQFNVLRGQKDPPGGYREGRNSHQAFTSGLFLGITLGSGRVSTLESLISFLGQTVAHRPQLSHRE